MTTEGIEEELEDIDASLRVFAHPYEAILLARASWEIALQLSKIRDILEPAEARRTRSL
jgi:hypothetical protein